MFLRERGGADRMEDVQKYLLWTDEMRHMIPLDCIAGFDVRPGFYIYEGATPIPME